VSAEVELRMLEGSEFQTVGAAMLKLREAKVVRTRGTDKSLWAIFLLSFSMVYAATPTADPVREPHNRWRYLYLMLFGWIGVSVVSQTACRPVDGWSQQALVVASAEVWPCPPPPASVVLSMEPHDSEFLRIIQHDIKINEFIKTKQ